MTKSNFHTKLYVSFLFGMLILTAPFAFDGHAKDVKNDTESVEEVRLKKDKFIDIQEVVSDSGIKAWLVEDHAIPVISLIFGFKDAGSKLDPANMQGLTSLAASTMDEGAGNLDSQAFQKELQDLSISLSFSGGRDNFGGSVRTLTKNKERAFELLKLALTSPRFDEEPLTRMRIANQSRIKGSMTQPNWIAARIQNDKIFHGHPYSLNSGGTLKTLENVKAEDLKKFTERLGKDNLVVSVAGDLSPDELKVLLDDVFGGLKEAKLRKTETFDVTNSGKTYLKIKEIPQTVIELAHKGISRKDPDYFSAQVMNFILGSSGFGSRLTEEVREKRGLTYGIYSYFRDYADTAVMHVSTSTANENVRSVLDLIEYEWVKMSETDISQKELENAQNYLIGSLPLSLTSTGKIAGLIQSIQMEELPIDYLDQREEALKNVTVSDVREVAQRLLDPDQFTAVLVGQPEGVDEFEQVLDLPNVE